MIDDPLTLITWQKDSPHNYSKAYEKGKHKPLDQEAGITPDMQAQGFVVWLRDADLFLSEMFADDHGDIQLRFSNDIHAALYFEDMHVASDFVPEFGDPVVALLHEGHAGFFCQTVMVVC